MGAVKPHRETVDDYYMYAREVAKLDFAALTDHDFSLPDSDWRFTQEKAGEYNEPHRFITFSAYEWTSLAYGHRNVYFLDDDRPLFRCVELNSRPSEEKGMTPTQLWSLLRREEAEAITVPHHPSLTQFPVDWDFYDPEFDRLVEITSIWGNFEYHGNLYECPNSHNLPGHFVQDVLTLGNKLGIIGGGDTHDCHPGSDARVVIKRNAPQNVKVNPLGRGFVKYFRHNPLGCGLAAVYAKELTREAVFDALKERRCYATTGAKILVDFRMDNHMMGEEYSISTPDSHPEISVKVRGTAKIDKIAVVKNSRTIHTHRGKGSFESFRWTDEEIAKAENHYYIRVTQTDGQMAWSSPIWVKWDCLPDLSVSHHDLSIEQGSMKAVIRNMGGLSAHSVRVRFYLEPPCRVAIPDKQHPMKQVSVGTLVWGGMDKGKIQARIRFKSRGEAHNFTGNLEMVNYVGYAIRPYRFAKLKYGGDLFTDNGAGCIKWDVTPSSRLNRLDAADVKGLDITVYPEPYKHSFIGVDVLRDGKRRPDETYLGSERVKGIPFRMDLISHSEGAQIGSDHLIPMIPPGGKGVVKVDLHRLEKGKAHQIFVVADPFKAVAELTKENNQAYKFVTLEPSGNRGT